MKDFKWTQTALKDLEKESTCPVRWKAQWLDGLIPFMDSVPLQQGRYFEYLVIGGTAKDDKVEEPPRTSRGDKTAAVRRIEEQAELCKRYLDPSDVLFAGIYVDKIQLKLKDGDTEGTLDFTGQDAEHNHYIVDLKLTYDVEATRTEYGWGHEERRDYLQQVHYADLYEKEYGVRPICELWVFDYSTNLGFKRLRLDISEGAYSEKDFRFDRGREVVAHYQKEGWSYWPSEGECANCPLNCDRRFIPEPVEPEQEEEKEKDLTFNYKLIHI